MRKRQECYEAKGKTVRFISKDKSFMYEGKVERVTDEEKSCGVVVNNPIRYKLNKDGLREGRGEIMEGKTYMWSEFLLHPENDYKWFVKGETDTVIPGTDTIVPETDTDIRARAKRKKSESTDTIVPEGAEPKVSTSTDTIVPEDVEPKVSTSTEITAQI